MGEGEKSQGALQTVSCDHFRFLVNVDKIFGMIKVRDISCYVLERLYLFNRPRDKSGKLKIIFLFLNQNIFCGYSKEPFQ